MQEFPTYGDDLSKPPSIPGYDLSGTPKFGKMEFPTFDDAPPAPPITMPEAPLPVKTEAVPFKKEKSVGGFASNFVNDATTNLKELGRFLFVDIPSIPIKLAMDEKYRKVWGDRIGKIMDDPLGQGYAGGGALIKAIINPYKEHGWDIWYEKPFTMLADVATLASLGAGAAAKGANVVGKATTVGQKLTSTAATLSRVGEAIDPFTGLARAVKATPGVKQVAKGIGDYFGVGEHSPNLSRLVAETRAEALAERAAAEASNLAPEAIRTGRMVNPEIPGHPHVGLAVDDSVDIMKQAENQLMKRMKLGKDVDELVQGKLPSSPTIQNRIRDTMLDIKWRRDGLDRIWKYLDDNNLLETKFREGLKAVDLDGYKRFMDNTENITLKFQEGMTAAIKNGADDASAYQAGIANAQEFIKDVNKVQAGKEFAFVPTHVAQFLKHEFAPRTPWLTDSIFKYWSPAVTVFKFPMYQASVLIGNAVMGLLSGAGYRDWALANKLRAGKQFPAELDAALGGKLQHMEEWSRGEGAFGPVREWYLKQAEKVGNITGGSDVKLKQLIVSKNLRAAIQDSLPVGKTLEAAVGEVLNSKVDLRNIISELNKQVARSDDYMTLSSRSRAGGNVIQAEADLAEVVKAETARRRLEALIPDYQRKVALLDKAIEEGNRWTGSYLHLHPFERNVLSRIVPFYTYTKAMTQLAFHAPFWYPKRMFMLNRLADLTAEMMHDPQAPEWVNDYVPFGTTKDGDIVAFRFGALNPFSGQKSVEAGELNVPAIFDLTRNPLVKLGYDMVGGIPRWSKKPMSPGEYAVRYGDGSVYEYQGDGTIKKVISTPSITRSLLSLFPQAQAVEQLVKPYIMDDRGEPLGGLDAKGNPRFPKELWSRIFNMFSITGTTYNPAELAQQEKKKYRNILREFQQELRYEKDPIKRQQYLDIIRDASQADVKRIER